MTRSRAPAPLPKAAEGWYGQQMRWLFRVLVGLLVVGALALAGGAWWLQSRTTTAFRGFAGDEVFVQVPQGLGVNAIATRLAAAGVVPDPWTFRVAVWRSGAARSLKAGEYRFGDAATPVQVVERLSRGDVYLRTITFPEGWTLREMAAAFEARGFGAARAFTEAAGDASRVQDLDTAAPDLEGYLFPDTYALPRGATASDLVGMMVARFRSAVGEDLLGRAAAQPGGLRAALTLASLVEKETSKADERRVVAGVYRNRLQIGMGLQCDPTVIYALARDGKYTGNLRKVDLQYDSPYNTYRYAGLPPGPIASPGRASIEAALAAADVPFLYFVSRNDGSHVFATTLAEHNTNVYEHQVRYFRQKRLRERAERGSVER